MLEMRPAEASLAADRAFDAETIQRLARLDTRGHPVLSIYVDLDPGRFPTPDTRETQLGALLDEARRGGADRDADRVEAWLAGGGAIRGGARGVAIFSSTQAGVFEAVSLAGSVEPLAVVDAVPWLEPLAAQVSPGDWGVAVVSRRAARLLRGGAGGLSEFVLIDDELHRRHSQGGWSQARFQRGIEQQVAAHVRGVADRLLRAHQRQPFQHLVVICSGELRPVIERGLHSELTAVLDATVDADLEHASVGEIVAAIAPVFERVGRDRERDLISTLEQELGTGGPAAAGLDDVLSALEQRRVETLLVPERSDLRGGLCPTCGRLSTDGERRCPLDGQVLAEVDAVEYAIDEAAGQSAQVVVARHEPEWLHGHGDIAALLRW
jgi:peptide chain release factor subunit 1